MSFCIFLEIIVPCFNEILLRCYVHCGFGPGFVLDNSCLSWEHHRPHTVHCTQCDLPAVQLPRPRVWDEGGGKCGRQSHLEPCSPTVWPARKFVERSDAAIHESNIYFTLLGCNKQSKVVMDCYKYGFVGGCGDSSIWQKTTAKREAAWYGVTHKLFTLHLG